jgi:hypothetical protein
LVILPGRLFVLLLSIGLSYLTFKSFGFEGMKM